MPLEVIRKYGKRVGYNEMEMEELKEGGHRIRHINALARASQVFTIQFQVVSAVHCNTGYAVGDKFILDVDGNIISKLNPKRLCVYLVSQMMVPVALINERLSEGLSPGEIHFMQYIRCPDAGVQCLGYGQVMARVAVIERRGKE
ncbi:MAG: hypothetical protein JL50_05260 [Peptococcaceae bacterium BICA1-7]|nr:MAG: hypothetical protein JL50_05260 [Peptococcaceae bacterium BICA1-7]HBV96024.1 hypothetical protein [Desulfotomaculum sp.]